MAGVGNRVTVKISDTNLGGMIKIGKGASMSVPGEIIQDLGHSWLVRLNISVGGKNQIVISKTAET